MQGLFWQLAPQALRAACTRHARMHECTESGHACCRLLAETLGFRCTGPGSFGHQSRSAAKLSAKRRRCFQASQKFPSAILRQHSRSSEFEAAPERYASSVSLEAPAPPRRCPPMVWTQRVVSRVWGHLVGLKKGLSSAIFLEFAPGLENDPQRPKP